MPSNSQTVCWTNDWDNPLPDVLFVLEIQDPAGGLGRSIHLLFAADLVIGPSLVCTSVCISVVDLSGDTRGERTSVIGPGSYLAYIHTKHVHTALPMLPLHVKHARKPFHGISCHNK